jgi:hypothetical protein
MVGRGAAAATVLGRAETFTPAFSFRNLPAGGIRSERETATRLSAAAEEGWSEAAGSREPMPLKQRPVGAERRAEMGLHGRHRRRRGGARCCGVAGREDELDSPDFARGDSKLREQKRERAVERPDLVWAEVEVDGRERSGGGAALTQGRVRRGRGTSCLFPRVMSPLFHSMVV